MSESIGNSSRKALGSPPELWHSPVKVTLPGGHEYVIWANSPMWVLVTYTDDCNGRKHDAVQGPMTFEQAQKLKADYLAMDSHLEVQDYHYVVVNLSPPMIKETK